MSDTRVVRVRCIVVAALAAAGVQVPVSREQGVCGTCLTDEKHARGEQMTLCRSRATSPRLVLDL